MVAVKVPEIGESITEALVSRWLKQPGDPVRQDEPLVELETDKATVELPSPAAGVLGNVQVPQGQTANVGQVIAEIQSNGAQAQAAATAKEPTPQPPTLPPAAPAPPQQPSPPPSPTPQVPPSPQPAPRAQEPPPTSGGGGGTSGGRQEELVAMSPMRRTIARRLVEAQQTAALLTTFNEIDMSGVVDFRKQYGEDFQRRYNIKLGFMSFFVKASIDALKRFPGVNAEVRGSDIAYRNYYDIGIAISTDKGLVVPVLRDADRLSFAEVERAIGDFAERARAGRIKLEELQGGTFTITNGGVFGSLLSTPIINPPQSGILGMHTIQPRPIAVDGSVVVRPMMYVALTYDHRVVDGREAVLFLRRIKETVESPLRLLAEV